MPIEIEPLLSDKDIALWREDQRWWYIVLLLRAWQKVDHPCRLPNDSELLRIEAGVPDKKRWEKLSPAVLAKFHVSADKKWLSNQKQLEVYRRALRNHRKRKRAGALGGKQKASNARAMLEQNSSNSYHTSSLSISNSTSNSVVLSSPKNRNTESYMERLRVIGFRRSHEIDAEHALAEVLEAGADAEKVIEACAGIYIWSQHGKYVRSLATAIRRWTEPRHLWERTDGKARRAGIDERLAISRDYSRDADFGCDPKTS